MQTFVVSRFRPTEKSWKGGKIWTPTFGKNINRSFSNQHISLRKLPIIPLLILLKTIDDENLFLELALRGYDLSKSPHDQTTGKIVKIGYMMKRTFERIGRSQRRMVQKIGFIHRPSITMLPTYTPCSAQRFRSVNPYSTSSATDRHQTIRKELAFCGYDLSKLRHESTPDTPKSTKIG